MIAECGLATVERWRRVAQSGEAIDILPEMMGLTEEEARAAAAEVLRIFPGASIEDSRQRCLYVPGGPEVTHSEGQSALLERFFDGLRKAGMPEGEPGTEPIEMMGLGRPQ